MKTNLANEITSFLCPLGDNLIKEESLQKFHQTPQPCILGIGFESLNGLTKGSYLAPLYLRDFTPNLNLFDLGDLIIDNYDTTLDRIDKFGESFHFHYPQHKLIAIGGDCSISPPLIKNWVLERRNRGIKVAVLEFSDNSKSSHEKIIPLLESPKQYIKFYKMAQQSVEDQINHIIQYFQTEKIEETYISFNLRVFQNIPSRSQSKHLELHDCTYLINKLQKLTKIGAAELVNFTPVTIPQVEMSLSPEPQSTLLKVKIILQSLLGES